MSPGQTPPAQLLQQLDGISQRLARLEVVESTLPEVLAIMGEAVQLSVAVLLLLRDDGQPAIPRFTWHCPGIDEEQVRAVGIRGAAALADIGSSDLAHRPDGNLLTLPLVVGQGRVFGVAAMQSTVPLGAPDIAFLSAATNYLAIAIDRASAAESRQALSEARREAAESSERTTRAELAQTEARRQAAEASEYLVRAQLAQTEARSAAAEASSRTARAELAQQQSEAHFRTMVAQVKDYAIFSVDAAGCVTSWNEGVREVLGFDQKEFVGRSFGTLIFTPEDLEAGVPSREIEEAARTGTAGNDRWLMRKDRTRFFAVGVTTAIRNERGELIGFAKVLRDQTRAKALEDALRESDRQKDEFLAMLAHELRNPLAPIGSASEYLSRRLPAEDSASHGAVDMIKRQATQLTRLVDDLLDVSRITRGRIHLRRQPLELSAIIKQAIETVDPLTRAKRHRISTTSVSFEPLYVSGDHARLVQCVANVLTNAIKYTDPGGTIRIETRSQGDRAVLEIADRGVGIAPELLPMVFDLFVQSERTLDRAQGGLGVGLAIVKRLVEMHNGEVTVSSAGVGYGTTVELRLPRIAPPQANDAESAPVEAASSRILIVDDNEDAANSLALLLSSAGHETQIVYSGDAALERVQSFQPEVALLDIGLPGMDGYELARRLRAMPRLRGVRLVALTGYGRAEDRERARAAGFDDHLVKPVGVSALERTLAGLAGAELQGEDEG